MGLWAAAGRTWGGQIEDKLDKWFTGWQAAEGHEVDGRVAAREGW
jgi:hypothetical protein